MISRREISRKDDFRRSSERKFQEKVTFGGVQRGIREEFREESAEGVQRGVQEEFREESSERKMQKDQPLLFNTPRAPSGPERALPGFAASAGPRSSNLGLAGDRVPATRVWPADFTEFLQISF